MLLLCINMPTQSFSQYQPILIHTKISQDQLKIKLDIHEDISGYDLEPHLPFIERYYLNKLKKTYNYFITATLKNVNDATLAEKWIRDRVHLSYISGIVLVKEHENTNLHFHYIMVTEKAVTKNETQKHYMSRFGHVDFRPLKTSDDYQRALDYISKENTPIFIS